MEKKKRSAYDEAARYLTNRMRTVSEMRAHLTEKEYDRAEIDYVISELVSMKYLDDYAYAKLFFERGYEKKRGASRLKRELSERGISGDVIESAFEDFAEETEVSEYDLALEVGRRAAEDMQEFGKREQDRIIRKLAGRGFAGRDIYRVVAEIRAERESDDE